MAKFVNPVSSSTTRKERSICRGGLIASPLVGRKPSNTAIPWSGPLHKHILKTWRTHGTMGRPHRSNIEDHTISDPCCWIGFLEISDFVAEISGHPINHCSLVEVSLPMSRCLCMSADLWEHVLNDNQRRWLRSNTVWLRACKLGCRSPKYDVYHQTRTLDSGELKGSIPLSIHDVGGI